jgi:hypothetical protein
VSKSLQPLLLIGGNWDFHKTGAAKAETRRVRDLADRPLQDSNSSATPAPSPHGGRKRLDSVVESQRMITPGPVQHKARKALIRDVATHTFGPVTGAAFESWTFAGLDVTGFRRSVLKSGNHINFAVS